MYIGKPLFKNEHFAKFRKKKLKKKNKNQIRIMFVIKKNY